MSTLYTDSALQRMALILVETTNVHITRSFCTSTDSFISTRGHQMSIFYAVPALELNSSQFYIFIYLSILLYLY